MKSISRDILEIASGSGCHWCILRKEDEILRGVHNDIDLFVSPGDYKKFILHIQQVFSIRKISIIRKRYMPAGVSYLLYSPDSGGQFEKLDILHENTLAFFSIFPSRIIEDNIVSGIAYPVLHDKFARDLSFRKKFARDNFLGFLHYAFKGRLWTKFWTRTFIKGYIKAYISNRRNPSGAFVVLVGPDGSGKTTVANGLMSRAAPVFFSVSVNHFNIQTFPRLSKLKIRGKPEPDYTLPESGTYAPIQPVSRAWIYLLYYGFELLIYTHLRLKRRLRQGQLVIFDRYFHDWLFQRSYRRASPRAIHALLSLAAQPSLVVYLKGDPSITNARKPELSAEEIGLQQSIIESNLLPYWRAKSVPTLTCDTTHSSPEVVIENIRSQLAYV
ncbi:nucleoside/nucleotide kinase family protein [Haliea atlantica]